MTPLAVSIILVLAALLVISNWPRSKVENTYWLTENVIAREAERVPATPPPSSEATPKDPIEFLNWRECQTLVAERRAKKRRDLYDRELRAEVKAYELEPENDRFRLPLILPREM